MDENENKTIEQDIEEQEIEEVEEDVNSSPENENLVEPETEENDDEVDYTTDFNEKFKITNKGKITKIARLVHADENNEVVFGDVIVYYELGFPEKLKFSPELIRQLARDNNIEANSVDELLNALVDGGLLKTYNSKSEEEVAECVAEFQKEIDDKLEFYSKNNELDEEEQKKARNWLKTLGVGALAASALGGGALLANYLFNGNEAKVDEDNKNSNTDFSKMSIEELMKVGNANQKEFFSQTIDFLDNSYNLTHKEKNFRIDADKDKYLDFTVQEVVSAQLLLNNYDQNYLNDLVEGGLELDSVDLETNFNSFMAKYLTYSMTAHENSGIDSLINDESSKKLFLSLEDAVIAYNNDATQENMNNICRISWDTYLRSGATGEQANKLESGENLSNEEVVSRLASMPVVGLTIEHRNTPEILVYTGESIDNGGIEKETKLIRTVKGDNEQVIENELNNDKYSPIAYGNSDIITEMNRSGGDCIKETSARLNDMILAAVDDHNNEIEVAKERLVTELRNNGEDDLAVEVSSAKVGEYGNLPKDLVSKLNSDKDSKDALDFYNKTLSGDTIVPSANDFINAIDKEQMTKENYQGHEDNLDILIGNRVNTYKLEDIQNYANIGSTTTSSSKKVNKSDLTPSERQEAERQEQEINAKYKIEELADNQAALLSHSFLQSTNVYKFADPLTDRNIDLNNGKWNFVSGVKATASYKDHKRITVKDSQIQAQLKRDSANFAKQLDSLSAAEKNAYAKKYGSNWRTDAIQKFEGRWTELVSDQLEKQYQAGIKADAESIWQKAMQEAMQENANEEQKRQEEADKQEQQEQEENKDKDNNGVDDSDINNGDQSVEDEVPVDQVVDPDLPGGNDGQDEQLVEDANGNAVSNKDNLQQVPKVESTQPEVQKNDQQTSSQPTSSVESKESEAVKEAVSNREQLLSQTKEELQKDKEALEQAKIEQEKQNAEQKAVDEASKDNESLQKALSEEVSKSLLK